MTEKSGRSPSIIAELRKRFPTEDVPPWGSVLAVPLQDLPKFQEEQLKKKGFRVTYQEFHGQLTALIVLSKQALEQSPMEPKTETPSEISPSPTVKQDEKQGQRWGRWSISDEQKLESLYARNDMGVWAIAEQLGRSPSSIRHKLEALKVKHALESQRGDASSDDQANIQDRKPPTAATKTPRDILVREYLEAAASLVSTRPKAAVVLQKEALFLSARGEGEGDREED